MKRKPGRPSKGRKERLHMLLSDEERGKLEALADAQGITASDWVRAAIRRARTEGTSTMKEKPWSASDTNMVVTPFAKLNEALEHAVRHSRVLANKVADFNATAPMSKQIVLPLYIRWTDEARPPTFDLFNKDEYWMAIGGVVYDHNRKRIDSGTLSAAEAY